MPNELAITMTPRGFEVRFGAPVTAFTTIEGAVNFAQERRQYAVEFRYLKSRID